MNRFAFVPLSWITSELSGEALRTLLMISTFADRVTGECWPSNQQLVNVLNRSERAIRMDLDEIQQAGLIAIENRAGKNRVFRITSEEWYTKRDPKRPANPARTCRDQEGATRQERAGMGETTRQDLVVNPAKYGRQPGKNVPGPNKNITRNLIRNNSGSGESVSEESEPVRKSTTTTGAEIEPFESGLPATLPNVRNGIAPFRNRTVEIVPTKLKPETVAAILEVLGTDGDQFARKITQEQADAGFPDWVLSESRNNRTPVKLAFHLLKTAWREDWVDPQEAENARLEEMADMIRSLK